MARRTKEDAEQTRADILNSALDIFYEKGYSKTTFDEIAKRINLTKGAVYWHFRNKPDIITALIKEAFQKTNDAINKRVPEVNNLDDLRNYFSYDAMLLEQTPIYRKFLFFILFQMEWSETIFSRVGASLKEIRDFPTNIIKEALTNAQKSGEISPEVNINEIAITIFSLWTGMRAQYVSNNIKGGFQELFCKSFDLIVNSLKDERSKNEVR